GDLKQAIYSFRNADLPTYLAARQTTDAAWTLADNQRSVQPLIAALNTLFTRHAQPLLQPGLDYVPVQLGAKPRPQLLDTSGGATAALQLWRLPLGDDGQPLAKPLLQARVVQATAAEIARLIQAGRDGRAMLAAPSTQQTSEDASGQQPLDDLSGQRPLAAGDIAVLVRSHRQGSLVRQALAALGVGSVELSQASLFHSPDAEDLERLLAAVLEPTRVPLLKAALATPLLGLDAAAVLALGEDEAALQTRMQRLADWKALWARAGLGAMLRRLMRDEAVAQRLLQRPDGERRLTNLLHLAELLHQGAQQHRAPEALLRWLQSQRQAGRADEASQLRLDSDRHLVQIITIHKSKGLEYGVVFCPFLWDGRLRANGDGLEGLDGHDGDDAVIDFRAGLDPAFDDAAAKEAARHEAAA
ncbi:MAG: exodeoxyribonuclease V subunit beta, partial [Burkholderiales bacterium PBB5]